jgi:hypothetical protein
LKIKPLTKEQIIISIDRLTRFKNTEIKYLRVFKDIVVHNLLSPNFSKSELDEMDYSDLKNYAQEIFNFSLKTMFGKITADDAINKRLAEYEQSVFKCSENTLKLLDNALDYQSCMQFINQNSPNNLKWLKSLSCSDNVKALRNKESFKFPVEKVVLVEGATEELLLPEFAKLCDYDFDKNGIYIIPAGGKNQVVKLYYELCETLKLPIFVLLDKDGVQNAKEISYKQRKKDKIHIIECGEFEDLLSKDLVERTLNEALENISEINDEICENAGHRVEYLEEIFKHRGMHEFKKVEFSQMVKNHIKSSSDLTSEICEIVKQIKNL